MPPAVLLGPQRLLPVLADAVETVGVRGRVAAVTAGWQEREAEMDELSEHLGSGVVNLRLYRRAEEVFSEDRDLFTAYRERQDRLRRLQEIYRLRLGYAMDAARRLLRRSGDRDLLDPARESAVAAVRALDAEHLDRLAAVHSAFRERWRPDERPAVARHREEIGEILAGCTALAVAGGHVAVLLNRLRLFGVGGLLGDRPLFAWSGGAMVVSERVVLFHDSPPQGRGNAEVLASGLGIARGVLPLPHARRRLRLEDRPRVELLARRFADSICVAMDEGARLEGDGRGSWTPSGGALQLRPDGSVVEVAR